MLEWRMEQIQMVEFEGAVGPHSRTGSGDNVGDAETGASSASLDRARGCMWSWSL